MNAARPVAPRIAISPEDLSTQAHYQSWRRSFATVDLPVKLVETIAGMSMHPRHNKLNALLGRGRTSRRSQT
jgi:hypothetical protein